jgi:hypothetical protein
MVINPFLGLPNNLLVSGHVKEQKEILECILKNK